MIKLISKVVDKIIGSKRLESLEKTILDKYESYATPKPVVIEPEPKEDGPKEPTKVVEV
jgi:hypothetical protein